MTNKKPAILLTLLLCVSGFAQSREGHQTVDVNTTLLFGPGVVVLSKPYAGVDPTIYPYPVTVFIYDRFYFAIDTAGYRLLANQRTATPAPGTTYLYLDAIAHWRTDGFNSEDSDKLDGMHNRHQTIDAGGEFGVSGDWGAVTTSLVADTLNQHNGREIRLVYSKLFKNAFDVNNLSITPSTGPVWQNDNLVNYYYGVRPDEARAGRPAYRPGSGVNWLFGLNTHYLLNEDWTLLTGINYYRLDSEIRNSPIVSRNYTISFIAGAMYKF
jgi:outer membrane protein